MSWLGEGSCKMRSNASWVVVTWETPPPTLWTDRHNWKHYLSATSLTGDNKLLGCNETTTAAVTGDSRLNGLLSVDGYRDVERDGEDVFRIRHRTIHSEGDRNPTGDRWGSNWFDNTIIDLQVCKTRACALYLLKSKKVYQGHCHFGPQENSCRKGDMTLEWQTVEWQTASILLMESCCFEWLKLLKCIGNCLTWDNSPFTKLKLNCGYCDSFVMLMKHLS